jgi:hypothetical protein
LHAWYDTHRDTISEAENGQQVIGSEASFKILSPHKISKAAERQEGSKMAQFDAIKTLSLIFFLAFGSHSH